jgi:hypothetical protein
MATSFFDTRSENVLNNLKDEEKKLFPIQVEQSFRI